MSTVCALAQQLETTRLARGLTRQQLTEKAGVSRQAVYRLFKGNDVQLSTLLAVMDVLELDLLTMPRALKRGLVDVGPIAGGLPPDSVHSMSAVQQRLARLKMGQP